MSMKQIVITASLLLAASATLMACAQAGNNQSTSANKPNIVFLFSDDAGYEDFGFQGSKVMITPNLDKLAAQGVKFTRAPVVDVEKTVREIRS